MWSKFKYTRFGHFYSTMRIVITKQTQKITKQHEFKPCNAQIIRMLDVEVILS